VVVKCAASVGLYVDKAVGSFLVTYLVVCGADCKCSTLLEGEPRSYSPRYVMHPAAAAADAADAAAAAAAAGGGGFSYFHLPPISKSRV